MDGSDFGHQVCDLNHKACGLIESLEFDVYELDTRELSFSSATPFPGFPIRGICSRDSNT
jgi:hypothetical protein